MKVITLIAVISYCTTFSFGLNIIQANGAISINQFTEKILKKYDQNKDGILDVADDSFLRTESENMTGTIIVKTESRGLLFTDADASGNKDGQVTNSELNNYIKKFDENGNSDIDHLQNWFAGFFYDSEWEKFDNKYEERYKYEVK